LPERTWSKRKTHGPTLRQHEMDVLAFIKARLKDGTRKAAQGRRKAAAAKLLESAAHPEISAPQPDDASADSGDQPPDEKRPLVRTGS
jgi:hypothetical protein